MNAHLVFINGLKTVHSSFQICQLFLLKTSGIVYIGNDTVTFQGEPGPVAADLRTVDFGDIVSLPQATLANQESERLVSIENLIGSRFNDFLFGNEGQNTLNGGGGDDFISARGGENVIVVPPDAVGNLIIDGFQLGIDTFVFERGVDADVVFSNEMEFVSTEFQAIAIPEGGVVPARIPNRGNIAQSNLVSFDTERGWITFTSVPDAVFEQFQEEDE